MGKKEGAKKKEEAPAPPPSNDAAEKKDEDEDTPCIKALKEIDDRYCAARMVMEAEVEKLRRTYAEKQAPILEERRKILSTATADTDEEEKAKGTPGCPDFWLTAFTNEEDLQDIVQDHDRKPLSYLKDMKASYLDPENVHKGIKIEFEFAENPFFTNTNLFTEIHMDAAEYKPWKEQPTVLEIKASEVQWNAGKNVTVAKVQKDGPAKKGKKKPAKAKEEPCMSFFRLFFTSVKQDDEDVFREKLGCCYGPEDDDDDEDEQLERHLENIGSLCDFIMTQFVPYAVRYYTGEACEGDDDDEDGEEESSLDESDEDDSEDEKPPPKPKGKKSPKTSPQMKPKAAPGGGADGQKAEECKQQ